MIKYVLNSGGISDKPELARQFFTEIVNGLGDEPRMLLCLFAQPREDWEEKYRKDAESIPAFVPQGIQPIFEMAFPDKFEAQVAGSDAVYFHGGDDHLVQYWLKKFDLNQIFQGKTIGTNSASSHALAKHFWTCDWRQCMDGLGILPIKFLAHFRSTYGNNDPRGPIDWDRAYDELSGYGDTTLPIHALEEGRFVVLKD